MANVASAVPTADALTASPGAASQVAARSPWIRGPVWDLALLAFPWVPFFFLFVFWMHLGSGGAAIIRRPEFATAVLIDLGLIFAHRHYVFLMVFGDRRKFDARPRAFIGSAVFIVAATIAAWFCRGVAPWVWSVVLVISVVWNIWHSVMQRYGIGRIYAGRVGAGLEAGEHAARDKRLLWSGVLLVATGIVVTRTQSLRGHPSTEAVLRTVKPVLSGIVPVLALGVAALIFAATLVSWVTAESEAKIPARNRIPRLTFLASTFALLVILYVYGPVVGFLVFASAHAVEYMAFVHHFAAKSYADRRDRFAASVLRRPMLSALVIVPVSFCLYAWMRMTGVTLLAVFIIYEVAMATVHFVYDGWVWKARSPAVKKPLGLA